MDQADVVRRLRAGGILAVVTIALAVVVQAGVIEYRFATAPIQAEQVNQSGLRRAQTVTVLYDADRAAADPFAAGQLVSAIDALDATNDRVGGLGGTDRRAFEQFVATARQVAGNPHDAARQTQLRILGLQLYAAFDRATLDIAGHGNAQRSASRTIVLVAGGVILTVVAALYVFVMRRREAAIETALKVVEERRQRFAAMFDNSSELMCIYRADGTIVRANRAALERMRFTAADVGKRFDVHVAAAYREMAQREFAAAAAGQAVELSTVFLDADGQEVPVVANLAPIVIGGRVVGIVGSARDVTVERQFEAELVRSNERFRSLFESSANSTLAVDAEGIITGANAAFERLTGYAAEEIVGRHFEIVVPPGLRAASRARFSELMYGPARSYEALAYTKDGHEINVIVDATPIRVGNRVEGMFYTSHDVTAERALRRRIEEKDERITALLQVASSAWMTGSQIDEALFLGTSALRMQYGYVIRMHDDGLFTVQHRHGPDDFLPVGHTMPATKSIGGRLSASTRALALDDLTIEPYASELRERDLPWKSYIGSRIAVDGAPYGALVFLDRDVHDPPFDQSDVEFIEVLSSMIVTAVARELHGKSLRERATHDKLTGLANRAALEEEFARALARARRTNEALAVHYIDLNGFKPINDTYGHAAGDEVLCEVARRFGLAVRAHDLVVRLGGDEFAVLQTTIGNVREVEILSARLIAGLEAPVFLSSGQDVRVGASFGTGLYPNDGADLKTLLEAADAAMYRTKRSKATGTQGA